MPLLIPYEIETLQQERPWANWLIVAACTLVSLIALFGGGLEAGDFDTLILDGFSLPGLVGHVLLHADLIHPAGNMIFLWVFGNASARTPTTGSISRRFPCARFLPPPRTP